MNSGLHRQGARDPGPLALAARELVRIAVERVARQPDDLDQLLCAPRRRAARSAIPWTRSGSASIEPIVIRGFSEA